MKSLRIALLALLFPGSLSSVILAQITKTPVEAFSEAVNFFNVAGNDGISLVSVTAVDTKNGQNVTSIFIGSPAPVVTSAVTINGVTTTGTFIVFRLQGGSNNQQVLIDAVASDNVTGEIFDGQIRVQVISGSGH